MSTKTTGWPPGLLQDESRKLSIWFATRPGARRQLRELYAGDTTPEMQGATPEDRQIASEKLKAFFKDSAARRESGTEGGEALGHPKTACVESETGHKEVT